MAGFQRGHRLEKLGLQSLDIAEFFFEDVEVPKANVLGDPVHGFFYVRELFVEERLMAAVSSIAHAQVGFDVTLEYLTQRRAYGTPAGAFQGSRFEMAALRAHLDALQTFVDQAVMEHNAGRLAPDTAAELKLLTTELENRGARRRRPAPRRGRLPSGLADLPDVCRRPRLADACRQQRDHEGDHRPLHRPRRTGSLLTPRRGIVASDEAPIAAMGEIRATNAANAAIQENVMPEAYIVAALRTAGGRKGGRLSGWHPVDLAAKVLDALVDRTGADPAAIEDVIMGCVGQVGEQSTNVARNTVMASKLPESVPGTSVDRQCGSSQQALHFAAQAVMSGTMEVVIAAGVESMTRVPMLTPHVLPLKAGLGMYMSPQLQARYAGVEFSQFLGAEMMAKKYGLGRAQLDAFALESHRRAIAAAKAGAFSAEIVPLAVKRADGGDAGEQHTVDEGIRFDASLEALAGLKTLQEGGTITAGNASQICDGASGALVVNEKGLKRLGVQPLARIHHMSVLGHDPVIMLEGPIPATKRALQKAGLRIQDIDLYEVNEAFSPVPLAWVAATEADPARLNVNGGAIALGHPLGASGTKLMATLVHALRSRKKRYGLQTMCEGGGMANVTIVERL